MRINCPFLLKIRLKCGIIIKNSICKGGDFLRSRYKLTKNLSNLINDIRESYMGYTHEEFADILDIEPSASYYMCKNIRMNTITPEKLFAIFAIDYNVHLFIRKYEQMESILSQEIQEKRINPKLTLRKLFGNKAKIVERNNPTLCKPPVSIFKEQKCYTDRCSDKLFDETLFPEELRYVKIPEFEDIEIVQELSLGTLSSEDEIKKATQLKSEFERIQAHIVKRIEGILYRENQNYLKQEYWLFNMYFLYKEVSVLPTCYEFIKNGYLQKGESEVNWLPIFKILGRNEHIPNSKDYEDDDFIYFRDRKETDISNENFPVFYYKYRTSYKDGSSETLKKYFDYYYNEERENACQLKFKLVHLFSIINQYYLSKGKTEDEAFKMTCIKLHLERITLPFEKLGLFELPPRNDVTDLTTQAADFLSYIGAYFNNHEISEKETELLRFMNNFYKLNTRFLGIISVDFSFLKRLGESYDADLTKKINEVTQKYKEDNLID